MTRRFSASSSISSSLSPLWYPYPSTLYHSHSSRTRSIPFSPLGPLSAVSWTLGAGLPFVPSSLSSTAPDLSPPPLPSLRLPYKTTMLGRPSLASLLCSIALLLTDIVLASPAPASVSSVVSLPPPANVLGRADEVRPIAKRDSYEGFDDPQASGGYMLTVRFLSFISTCRFFSPWFGRALARGMGLDVVPPLGAGKDEKAWSTSKREEQAKF